MYSCGETVLPVCPTWYWCGYQPASVAARDAPTAAPRESASASITPKPSAPPTPRPPETTIAASVSSGRPPFAATVVPVMRARVEDADTVTGRSRLSQAAGAASGATELPRTVMTGMPVVTVECTTVEPPNTDCVATIAPASDCTSTASVMTPEPIFSARRAAASLPSAVDGDQHGDRARSRRRLREGVGHRGDGVLDGNVGHEDRRSRRTRRARPPLRRRSRRPPTRPRACRAGARASAARTSTS